MNEHTAKAKEVIANIKYITLATTDKDGNPWNSPVYSAYDEDYTFYWASWTENQHSKNIRENPNVFAVIYDSTVPEGTGVGVYMRGKAYEINDREEVVKASARCSGRVKRESRAPEEYLAPNPRRRYKFIPEQMWVNKDGERDGKFVDERVEITELL